MTPEKWVKRPVAIEAMRWDGTADGSEPVINWALSQDGTISYVCGYLTEGGLCPEDEDKHHLVISTLEGDMIARAGYYIIRGVEGEFYGCEPKIFHQTYEPA